MKNQIQRRDFDLHRAILWLMLIVIFALTGGCGPAPQPGVQVTKTGWEAQRYGLYNKVWGSTISTSQVDLLTNTWKKIVVNGYVTTDSNGQGKMRKDYPSNTCTVYVFQQSSAGVLSEAITTCPKGTTGQGCTNASTWLLNNCGIRAVTLPASVVFKGTMVTIIEYRELEVAVVLSSEGVAEVTPTDQPDQVFEVHPGLAAYAVTNEFREQAEGFFGFPPGVEVDFEQMIGPIESMDQVRQIQSANLILRSQGLPMVPLPEPIVLGLRWLTDQPEDFRVTEAAINFIDWVKLGQIFPDVPMPSAFEAHGETLDLRSIPYDTENARRLLDEAGYPTELEIFLVYDESIPGLADLAFAIADELRAYQRFVVNIQSFNPDNAEAVFAELEATNLPILVLSGY